MKESKCFYHLEISALVPEIFKFAICVKYANEMTDDAIHSTQYYLKRGEEQNREEGEMAQTKLGGGRNWGEK